MQLNHKRLPVDIVYNTLTSQEAIKIGDDTFQMTGEGGQRFDGCRIVTEGTVQDTKVLADEGVSVNMGPKDIAYVGEHEAQFADECDLANKDECHFTPGDNALVIRKDNINQTCVANFAHLGPVPQPGGPRDNLPAQVTDEWPATGPGDEIGADYERWGPWG